LDQFFKQTAIDQGEQLQVLGSGPQRRLEYSEDPFRAASDDCGPACDIVTADLTGIELETGQLAELWDLISEDNDFSELTGGGHC